MLSDMAMYSALHDEIVGVLWQRHDQEIMPEPSEKQYPIDNCLVSRQSP